MSSASKKGTADGTAPVSLKTTSSSCTFTAARLCVLATRIGGIREVVEDGVTGMLVQPRDSHALARAIEKLLTDPELRQKLAANGFLPAQSEYSWEKIAARFEDLYRRITEEVSQDGR